VTVPALVLVRVDSTGAPVAAATNTLRAPCSSDRFVILAGGGTRRATAAQRLAVVHTAHGGDWTQSGRWQPLVP
jgi:hypothetical protein